MTERAETLKPWAYNHRTAALDIQGESAGAADFDTWARPVLQQIVEIAIGDRQPSDLRALDLGCLEGHNTDVLCGLGFGEVVGVDISELHIARARFLLQEMKGHDNVHLIVGNATDVEKLRTLGLFDVVVFHGLLYHLKDPLRGLDVLEAVGAPGHTVLLQTQYKGGFWAVVSPAPIAELQLKPLTASDKDPSILLSPKDGSAFERCSLRLNPAAVYHALLSYGYCGQIAYDTPSGISHSFHSNLVLTKDPDPSLLERLRSHVSVEGVRFYLWNGSTTNSYDFQKNVKARALRLALRLMYGRFTERLRARLSRS